MATKAKIDAAADAMAKTHQGHVATLPYRLIRHQAEVAVTAAEKVG